MDILGILSLIFGSIGTILSYWYIGIIPCVVGTVLGIVGLTDCFSDRKFSLFGLLISVFGIILTAYIVVSDVDADRLLVKTDKFRQEEQSVIAESIKPTEVVETEDTAKDKEEKESDAKERQEDLDRLSMGQENAIRSAKTYLEFMPFSYQGLVRQLEFEGFTHEQAVYGVEQNGY